MKIELEINDALVHALGEETIRHYLNQKVKQLEEKCLPGATPISNPDNNDKESIQKAWDKFNKRGMSC